MGAVNSITDSVSSALGTDGGGGGALGVVNKLGDELAKQPILTGAYESVGREVAKVPILKAAVIAAGTYFGGPAGAAIAGSLMSRASGNSFNQSLWNGIGTGATVAGAMYGADKLFSASGATSAAGAPGTFVPGVGAGEAGYTMTGDAIADTAALTDMGYSGTQAASLASGTTGAAADPGLMSNLGQLGIKALGSYLTNSSAQNAAQNEANSRNQSAAAAAAMGKFRPVGVTSRFGTSNFQTDSNGNLVNASYSLAPDVQAQQDILMGMSNPLLSQYAGAQSATAPMGTAASRMMSLGNQYLATDPQVQAAKYLADQQGLLAPGRASTLADLQAQMQAQGRGGFAIGGGVNGQGAANPQLQALYNAQLQQDALLAANATQGGMDYAKFGGGLVGSGGDMLKSMYGTQVAAYDPYKTAIGGAGMLENMGKDALTMGANLGGQTMQGNQFGAGLMNNAGQINAANTYAAQAPSMWGSVLNGVANSPQGQQAANSAVDWATGKVADWWNNL